MVDLGKKKGGDDSKSKKKKSKSSVGGSSSGGGGASTKSGSGGSSPDPYSPSDNETANYEGGSVAEVSKEWAEAGDNLNYAAENGEAEKKYVKRQIKECKEFYEDYVDTALDNMSTLEEFTMVHHALLLSLAQNRLGIKDTLMDEFGYSEQAAINQTETIVAKAGEEKAFSEVTDELMRKIIEE